MANMTKEVNCIWTWCLNYLRFHVVLQELNADHEDGPQHTDSGIAGPQMDHRRDAQSCESHLSIQL